MSLVEMLIVSALLLMLVGMITDFFSPALRLTTEGTYRVQMEQQAALALNAMVAELQLTTSPGTYVYNPGGSSSPVILATDRIYSVDNNGYPMFDGALQIFYFNPSTNILIRKSYSGGLVSFSPSAPPSVSQSTLLNIAQNTNGTERNIAQNVQNFYIEQLGGGSFRVRLVLEQDVPNSQRKVWVKLTRQVFLRND